MEAEKIYIRFGKIPQNGKSKIYCGEKFIGLEKGISVYEALQEHSGKISILMPSLTYSACVSLSGCIERNAFIIDGELAGMGSDGEPLLKNCNILKKVSLI